MIDEMKAISHARIEMERVASAKGSPRILLARKLAILTMFALGVGSSGSDEDSAIKG